MRVMRSNVLCLAVGVLLLVSQPAIAVGDDPERVETLRVMSFNIWIGGEAGGQPLEQTAEVIRAAGADIVGIQESMSGAERGVDNANRLAEMLSWHHVNQRGSTSVISRFPIVGTTPERWGVAVELHPGYRAYVFNAHLPAAPYQPYQLLEIEYHGGRFITTEQEAIEEARAARGQQVDAMLAEAKAALLSGQPVFLVGDLNEPSHQDWTRRAARAGACPLAVAFPTTTAVTEAGFVDAYRQYREDEVQYRGNTWTPIKADDDPEERHDRIDFVFYAGPQLRLQKAKVVGEDSARGADIVVTPYPSDHRAVVAEFQIEKH